MTPAPLATITNHRVPQALALMAGAYAVIGGCVTLLGWALEIERLTDWRSFGISMFPNAAICAVLSGLSLVLTTLGGSQRHFLARVFAGLVTLIGGLTLFQHLTGIDLGIDRLLFDYEWGQGAAASPMRMGLPASTSFILIGLALLTFDPERKRWNWSSLFGLMVVAVTSLSLTGFLYGAEQMYTLPRLTGIALQTASILFALGLGIIASAPGREPMRTILEPGAIGLLARAGLPLFIVMALATGWVRVQIQNRGLVDTAFGTALRTLFEIFLLTGLLWRAIATLRSQDNARRQALRELTTLYAVGQKVAGALDRQDVLQTITDAATSLSGAQFGAFFYNAVDDHGEHYLLHTLSGAPREAFERFGSPRNTQVFAPTFLGQGVLRVADIRKDHRYGHNAPHRGTPEGHLPVVSYLAVPVVSRSGEVFGGLFLGHPQVGVFKEASERVVVALAAQAAIALDNAKLYAAEQRARSAAEDASRAKDQFLAMLSHELRNPLAAARNAVTVAALDPQRADRALVIGRRATDQLTRLVDDLLEVTRITQGRITLRQQPLALRQVVERAIEAMRSSFEGRDLQLHLTTEAVEVEGDAARLEQVVGNLLTNAAKYTEAGAQITVTLEQADGWAVLRVRDTGIGISTDLLPKVFDLFVQADQALDRTRGGLGIGLTLVKQLVEMHGGTVEAHSAGKGQGAEFVVRLPALARSQRRSAPIEPVSEATRLADGTRILIVEDNSDAAESLTMLLEVFGLRNVTVANDGIAGLAAARASAPDLMLIDIGLPGMNGYELAEQIRQDTSLRRIKLVALTGYGQEEDRRQARAVGFDHHLVKPVDPGELQKIVTDIA